MSWSTSIRKIHRVLSVTFTVAVIANFAVMGHEQIALWVGLLTLIPLGLLLLTGLYMFVLPYTAKWRAERRAVGQE